MPGETGVAPHLLEDMLFICLMDCIDSLTEGRKWSYLVLVSVFKYRCAQKRQRINIPTREDEGLICVAYQMECNLNWQCGIGSVLFLLGGGAFSRNMC